MKATDAVRIERQIPQAPGEPAQTVTEVVCPVCRGRVGAVEYTAQDEPFRSRINRLADGTLCPHGQTERDPVGTEAAF